MSSISPICDHCGNLFFGNACRVTSEEDGVILLDMVVCHSCGLEARRLGLNTEEFDCSRYAVSD